MPKFEVGDVVEWNHKDSDLMDRVKSGGYDLGPFLVTRVEAGRTIVVDLRGEQLHSGSTKRRKRDDYRILHCNLVKNIFLTEARKAVEHAR